MEGEVEKTTNRDHLRRQFAIKGSREGQRMEGLFKMQEMTVHLQAAGNNQGEMLRERDGQSLER